MASQSIGAACCTSRIQKLTASEPSKPDRPSIMSAPDLDRLFVERARDYLAKEYPAKLRITLNALPPDRLWWRPNQDSNSVGNLLLHLNGNLRQWIVAGVGGETYARHRAEEFAAHEGRPASELLADLERTLAD